MRWPSTHRSPSLDRARVGLEFWRWISAGVGVLEIVRLVHWTISGLYMVQPGVQRTKSHRGSRSEFRALDLGVWQFLSQSFTTWKFMKETSTGKAQTRASSEIQSLEVWSFGG